MVASIKPPAIRDSRGFNGQGRCSSDRGARGYGDERRRSGKMNGHLKIVHPYTVEPLDVATDTKMVVTISNQGARKRPLSERQLR